MNVPADVAYRFDGRVFDPGTGEIQANGEVTRLAPLPAALLSLLIQRAGGLVTREEIWTALWPDERIDLDQKLNFCIYQVRQALDDEASDPTYVETLPRRGYRFLPPVTVEASNGRLVAGPSVTEATGPEFGRAVSRRWTAIGAVSILAAASLLLVAVLPGPVQVAGDSGPAARADEPAGGAENAEAYRVASYILEEEPDSARLVQAERLLRDVVRRDSVFAPAYVQLAMVREELGHPSEARRLVLHALAVDSGSAEAHHVLGRMLLYEWQWEAARGHLERAIELEPDRAGAHHLLAHLAVVLGDTNQALLHARAARSSDPVIGLVQGDLGWIHLLSGRYEEAVRECEESISLVGLTPRNEECLITARVAQGRTGEGADLARRRMGRDRVSERIFTGNESPEVILEEYYRWGLDRLSSDGRDGSSVHAFARARGHAYLGETDQAFRLLRLAVAERDRSVMYANADPYFKDMRSDPRYREIAAEMNLGGSRFVTASLDR